jgi:hypothetical protein
VYTQAVATYNQLAYNVRKMCEDLKKVNDLTKTEAIFAEPAMESFIL